MIRHYVYINDFVKLYYDNNKILLVKKGDFMINFHDFLDLPYIEIRKKYKTWLIK